jgi:hypothetical protein
MRTLFRITLASVYIGGASLVATACAGAAADQDELCPYGGCLPGDGGASGEDPSMPSESSGGPDDDHDDDADPTGDDDPTGDPEPPTNHGLPCAVADALTAACGGCHGEVPSFGAPIPLVTYADLMVPSVGDPTRKVHEVVAERLVTDVKPMPPTGDITDEQRAVILDWIAAGAPEDATADCGDTPEPEPDPVGPQALPCEPTFEVRAHAPGSEAPFAVPAVGAEDLYQCFAFQAPFTEPTQAIAWAPIIDDERVVHHWILYRTQQPQEDGGVFPCDVSLQLSADFVAGWAPGGENVIMPPTVGLELGKPGDWYILQLHYHNAAGYEDSADASGVAFCTPPTPEPNTAGVLTLGTVNLAIPPGAVNHTEVGNCGGLQTLFWPELHIIGSSPHMHELGRAMKTVVHRGGAVAHTVIDKPFNFESQLMYFNDTEIVVGPGDRLETTCTFDNPGSTQVGFGEGTGDEMCFNFVLAYPIDQLGNRNCGIVF